MISKQQLKALVMATLFAGTTCLGFASAQAATTTSNTKTVKKTTPVTTVKKTSTSTAKQLTRSSSTAQKATTTASKANAATTTPAKNTSSVKRVTASGVKTASTKTVAAKKKASSTVKTINNKQVQAAGKTTVAKKTASQTAASKTSAKTQSSSKATASQSATKKTTTTSTKESLVKRVKEPNIRVLLGSRTASVPVQFSSDAMVEGSKKKFTTDDDVKVSVSGNTIHVNGKAVGTSALIKPKTSTGHFSVLGKSYYGGLRVTAVNGAMRLVNEVGLEDYVAGVLPYEMSPSWPQAALQAQAVAARTYALNNMKSNQGKDYDVTPSTDYQVYNGKEGETESTREAVRRTQGIVMTYNGEPINALFHSDGGGYTEDAVNVWGNDLPYLKGVKDFSTHAGTRSWLITTNRKEVESKLRAAGKSVGTLKRIELTPMGKQPFATSDRGVSGRVKQATFVGSDKKLTLTGDQLRSIFGLKSTLFDFYVNHKPSVNQKPGKSYHSFTSKNDVVYILGHGWGHGLGMSQWGA
ncbi:MAG: SpoIID/LytB domain-containing protein, partial [Veillonella sp.]|nr:SpoIID/LytB domain-containing protein [Veillonella sp.]